MTDNLFHYDPPRPDFEQWLAIARRAAAGGYTRDAILGGLRARLFTNHLPLADAWSDMFFGPQEWQHLVRQAPPPDAVMSLYAAVMKDHEPLSAVNPAQSTAVMINRTDDDAAARHGGGAGGTQVGRTSRLARARDVRDRRPTRPHRDRARAMPLWPPTLQPRPAGRSPSTIRCSVRITLTRQVDGVQLAPTRILTERGHEITGARILHWLRHDAYQEPRADVFCLTLDQRDEPVMARDLDLDRCAELYALPLDAHQSPTG